MVRILAVDGGGSKTYAVVIDELGNRFGTGLSGCGNYQTVGIDVALANIEEACAQSLQRSNLSEGDIDFVQYGLAGADRAKDITILRNALWKLPYSKWDLTCDTFEGLRLGSEDYTGVVLVCGAGTNAAGRNKQGKTVQIGGFGYLFGDRAGGYDMARETFSMAVRSWEHREIPSRLTELVPSHFGFSSMEGLVSDFLDRDVQSVPGDLTLVLHEAAEQGDELAIQYLNRVGKELALAGNAVILQLGGFGSLRIPVVLVGSVLQMGKSPHILNCIRFGLEKCGYQIEMKIPMEHPVYGSALIGFDHLNIPISAEVRGRMCSYGTKAD